MKFRFSYPDPKRASWLYGFVVALLLISSCSGNGDDSQISASGTIEATEIHVAAKVGGEVKNWFVREGSAVHQGDPLAVIDCATLDLKLKQVEAGVELAEAQLQLLLNGARSEDIQQAEEGVKQAEATLKMAQEDLKRMRKLFETGSATQKQRDDAGARYTVAFAQYNASKQALKKLRRGARPAELRAARARLAQARASVDLLKKTMADCTITAPISGIVTQKPVEAGELVGQGTTVLTLSKLELVYLMIYVNEVELGRVHLGQQAEVHIDTYPDSVFSGKVVYISPVAEFTPKNVQTKEDRIKLVFGVKIEMDNPTGTLKPGMPADATLKTAHFAADREFSNGRDRP